MPGAKQRRAVHARMARRKRLTAMPQSVLILGFNLFPALSAIVFGWSAFTLMLLYDCSRPVILLGQPLIEVSVRLDQDTIETGVGHWNDLSAGQAGLPTRWAARARNWTSPPRG